MFDLVFLGTSASVPSPERGHPALLLAAAGGRILIDCGEGVQRQLLKSGAGFSRLDRILLTHSHLDHVLGLPGLLATLGLQQRSAPLTISGSPRTLGFVKRLLEAIWGAGRAPVALDLVPLTPGRIAVEEEFTIDCFPVAHRDTDSFGFVFETPGRRHLIAERLTALGVPDGPARKTLAAERSVTLADGRRIDPEAVLGPPARGTKLVVIGDAETTDGLGDVAAGADALVIEATFLARDAATARSHGHLTAAESAALAAAAGVERLILTHISGRYADAEILAEARQIFPAAELAADFARIAV